MINNCYATAPVVFFTTNETTVYAAARTVKKAMTANVANHSWEKGLADAGSRRAAAPAAGFFFFLFLRLRAPPVDSASSCCEEQGEGASHQPPAPAEEHGTAEATQLHAANEALGQENALLRLKLDRLLHFATEELQAVTAAPPTTPPPRSPRPPMATQQRRARGFRGGSECRGERRCASALHLVDRGDYTLTGSGYCVW